jgi:AMMECR1 domain-containing protein
MMPKRHLSDNDRMFLLRLARESIENYVLDKPLPKFDQRELSEILCEEGASFVTLTIRVIYGLRWRA